MPPDGSFSTRIPEGPQISNWFSWYGTSEAQGTLEKQGVPVEFIRYPRSTHDLSRTGEPRLLVDRLARLRQWFSYWLMGEGTMVMETEAGGM